MARQLKTLPNEQYISVNVQFPANIKDHLPAFFSSRQAATYLCTVFPHILKRVVRQNSDLAEKAMLLSKVINDHRGKKKGENEIEFDIKGVYLEPYLTQTGADNLREEPIGIRCVAAIWTYIYCGKPYLPIGNRKNIEKKCVKRIVPLPPKIQESYKESSLISAPLLMAFLYQFADLQKEAVKTYLSAKKFREHIRELMLLTPLPEPEIAGEVFRHRLLADLRRGPQPFAVEKEQLSRLDPLTLFFLEVECLSPIQKDQAAVVLKTNENWVESEPFIHFRNKTAGATIMAETYIQLLQDALRDLERRFSHQEATILLQVLVDQRSLDQGFSGDAIIPLLDLSKGEISTTELRQKVRSLSRLERSALEIIGVWVQDKPETFDQWINHLSF